MSQTLYVESPSGRLYEVVQVRGYPLDAVGPCLCVVDYPAQRIEVSDTVPEADLLGVIGEYIGFTHGGSAWRLVPVRGRVA